MVGNDTDRRRSQHRSFIQASNNPAAAKTQMATPAANGNKLAKKFEPEKERAEEPNANIVPNNALIVKPSHSSDISSRFFLLQKGSDRRRFRGVDLRGLLILAAGCGRGLFCFEAFRAEILGLGNAGFGLMANV